MHYLGLALYAEGSTDYYFLRPVLLRLCMEVCIQHANKAVEFNEEVLPLDHPLEYCNASRSERILEACRRAWAAWRIIFIHADAAGDMDRARRELIQPAIDRIEDEWANRGVGVAVLPVRETESWTLVDGDALRTTFGTSLSDLELGVPRLNEIERVLDPKARLLEIFYATHPSARNRRAGPSPRLTTLGETISLAKLRELTSFS